MSVRIFDYIDFRLYIVDKLASLSRKQYHLAKTLNYSETMVSHILSGREFFDLKKAPIINNFLCHSKMESRYFVYLIEIDRASTQELKSHFMQIIDEIKKDYEFLNENVHITDIEDNVKNIFTKSWHPIPIHILTQLPQYRTVEQISNALSLDTSIVKKTLDLFVKNKMLKYSNGNYIPKENDGKFNLILPSQSEVHRIWREHSMRVDKQEKIVHQKNKIKQTILLTTSKENEPKIAQIFIDAIKKVTTLLHEDSQNNKIDVCKAISIDYFSPFLPAKDIYPHKNSSFNQK